MRKPSYEAFSMQIIRRYLSLCIPVFIISILIFFSYRLGVFEVKDTLYEITNSPWILTLYNDPTRLSFSQLFLSSFSQTILSRNDAFSTAFWMLQYIFYGSIFSGIFGFFYHVFKKKAVIIYGIAFLICIPISDYYFIFPLGALIAYGIEEEFFRKNSKLLSLGIMFCLLGVFLGNPTYRVSEGIYTILPKMRYISSFALYHGLGATLLIVGILMVPVLQKTFSMRPFKVLGNVSFEVYLIHIPILLVVGAGSFLTVYAWSDKYMLSVVISLLTTSIILMIVSYVYQKYISSQTNKVSSNIIHFLLEQK